MMQMKYPDEKKPFNERNYVRDWFQDFEILSYFLRIFSIFLIMWSACRLLRNKRYINTLLLLYDDDAGGAVEHDNGCYKWNS